MSIHIYERESRHLIMKNNHLNRKRVSMIEQDHQSCWATLLSRRGEWGEMAVGQNAQIDFVCYSIALAN